MAMQLSQLQHNDEVGLADDPAFRGYFAGSMEPDASGPRVMLVVKAPGKTGLTLYANKPFPLAALVALEVRRVR